jgi:hypothetical protein
MAGAEGKPLLRPKKFLRKGLPKNVKGFWITKDDACGFAKYQFTDREDRKVTSYIVFCYSSNNGCHSERSEESGHR